MTFRNRIDKILKHNTLGFRSVSAMEDYLRTGRQAINKFYNADKMPGRKTLNTILSLPGLNLTWWETGNGDVFCNTTAEKHTHAENNQAIMEKSDEKKEKSMIETIDDLVGMLKEDNAFWRTEYIKLRESNEKLLASLDSAHTDYVKLTTITLSHGQK